MPGRTLFDKVWDEHVVGEPAPGVSLLYVDRHLLHDLSGARGLREVQERGLGVRNPALTFATPDHTVSSAPGRNDDTTPRSGQFVRDLRGMCRALGITLFDINDPAQGIVHVIGPELGLTLPGVLLVCGDSHTCTHGGLGALAFGIGSTEVAHVIATQTIRQKKPKRMRVNFEGAMAPGVAAKDLILHLIGRIGAAGGNGHAVEYAGAAIRRMPVEGRMTVCNLSIELGAKIGMVAPDDETYQYLAGRDFAPKGELWDAAVKHWRDLPGDADARFDKDITIDVNAIRPQVTWGTSPEHVVAVDERVPDPGTVSDPDRRKGMEAALDYMDLKPGQPMEGLKVDWVFIGSCTNSRLSDLRAAAAIAEGRKVAEGVHAWIVPGSQAVKRAAEAEGLHQVFRAAGFEWREPGCSMCVAANMEFVPPGMRSVSTSNRNFVGRQGPGARTHLASPAMAAAAAIAGSITDLRKLQG
ncbi:MAG TPA: 3-isopropylmalate dehydratase large subunit [Candidatus Cybelea sp.]|nr:3-isopropylmalate dehydratase large subunit [Candidatus Cybelea sp.]